MTDTSWRLRFGGFDMSPGADHDGVQVDVRGLRRGKPVPVTRVVDSMLQDGAIERVDRHDNRDQTVIVAFKGSDADALAVTEAALVAEVRKQRNELAWTPFGGVGAETVFDVLWSDLEFSDADDWDLDELQGFRVWVLTLRALPFGRGATPVTIPALTSSSTPTVTVISDGTSATGWTSTYGTVTVATGQLVVPKDSSPYSTSTDSFGNVIRSYRWNATRTLTAVDFTASPYLTLEVDIGVKAAQTQIAAPKVYIDNVQVPMLSAVYLPRVDPAYNASPLRCTYLVMDPSASTLRVEGNTTTYGSTSGSVLLDNVSRSNAAPVVSTTGRMAVRTVDVGGSARTQASLEVSHATSPLGRAVVYTCPALSVGGYNPAIGQYRSSGGVGTADTATLSGNRFALSPSSPSFLVPAAPLPKGGYLLFLRARATTGTPTVTFTWSAQTQVGSTLMTAQSGSSAPVTLTTGVDGWQLVPIGAMVLPPTDVADNSSAGVAITIGGGASWEWDEALLFYMGDGAALTIVDCGRNSTASLGGYHNSLWVESPTLDNPAPRVLLGVDGAKETGFHAGEKAQAWGIHDFTPGVMSVFVATTNAVNPDVSLEMYERVHTYARRQTSG